MSEESSVGDRYVLTTGDVGARRLALLNSVYGPSTERLLAEADVRPGMRVVDFGCGTGHTTVSLARLAGHSGSVVGVDASREQLELARARAAELNLDNIEFVEASVYETQLARGSFDAAYARLILCHLQRPADMLGEMLAVLKPGGILICEDLDISTLATDPPTEAYREIVQLSLELGRQRGVDYCMGAHLYHLLVQAGLRPQVRVVQPAFASGEEKRVWEYTFLEAAPPIVAAGLASAEKIDELRHQLAHIAKDDRILVFQSRFVQFWATIS